MSSEIKTNNSASILLTLLTHPCSSVSFLYKEQVWSLWISVGFPEGTGHRWNRETKHCIKLSPFHINHYNWSRISIVPILLGSKGTPDPFYFEVTWMGMASLNLFVGLSTMIWLVGYEENKSIYYLWINSGKYLDVCLVTFKICITPVNVISNRNNPEADIDLTELNTCLTHM